MNTEEPIAVGARISVDCTDWEFRGEVVGCEYDAYTGYYVRIAFEAGCEWSPEVFKPAHLMRPGALAETACCSRGVCPKAVVATAVKSQFPLTGRVEATAQDVAALCGQMNREQAVECFKALFGAGPDCSLFEKFLEAHQACESSIAIGWEQQLFIHGNALRSHST